MLIPLPIVYVIVAILFFLICTITVFMISSKKWKSKYKNEIGSLKQDLDKKKTDLEHAKKQLEKQKDELIIAKNAADISLSKLRLDSSNLEKRKFELNKKSEELRVLDLQLKKNANNYDNQVSEYKQKIVTLEKQISDLRSKITFLEYDKRNLGIELTVHKDTERELRKEISDLRNLKSAYKIEELEMRLRLYKSSEEKYKAQIAEKNELIVRLDDHLTFYKNECEKADEKYSKEFSALKSQLSDENSIGTLFLDASNRLQTGAEKFFNYPTMHDFYERVKDKRFHRAMFEDISFLTRVSIKATVTSESGAIQDTSLTGCSCPDFHKTQQPCKHMMFLAYHVGVLSIRKDLFEKSMRTYFETYRITPVPKK